MSTHRRSPGALAAMLALLLGSPAGQAGVENIDPDGDGSQYAWGENVGWINAEPSGDGGPGVEVYDFDLAGWLWSENVGWINLSCVNNLTCASVDFGVANTGHGVLSGYAWSENAGWISFSCENMGTCANASYGVTIDPGTGEFTGDAWSETAGWISFSCSNAGSCAVVDYDVKTGWCQATAAAPSGTPSLTVGTSGSDALLSWPPLAEASWYEVVRGSLRRLHDGGGFLATEECSADDLAATSLLVPDASPLGDGFWFLVRGANCKGKGTYDTGAPSQVAPRDAAIESSGNDCP